MSYPVAANEEQRLRAVADLRILDTPRDAEFDAVVDLAREMMGVSISLISVIDKDRQWFKAAIGTVIRETPRRLAFCNHTIVGPDPFVVEDARSDPRFAKNPLVTGAPHIRFYAGVPLFLDDGLAVGSLCILNSEPRRFTEEDLSRLRRLGDIATSLLRQYRNAERVALLRAELTARHDALARRAGSLEIQKRIFEEVSSLAKLGAWTRDLQTGGYEWSDEMYALHEVDPDFELTDGSIASLYPPEEFRRLAELVAEAERTKRPFSFEGEMVTAKGNRRHVRMSAQFQFEDGVAVRRYGTVQDITQERTRAYEMARLAHHDSLTGLYNRSFVQDHLRSIPGMTEVKSGPVDLLLLDLDGFKDINDSHGHAAGDHCLKVVATRLASAAFAGSLVARLGGDEFAVLLVGTSAPSLPATIAASIIKAVAEPIQWMVHGLELTTSIGIAQGMSGSGFDPDRLLLEADLALYAAKEAGRNRLLQFDNSMKVSAYQRFLVLENIRNALKDGQLELHYQPKVKLVDGRCYGLEALIRWNSPDGRVVAPGAFAEALVDPKLGVEVGDFVIRAALDQAEAWAAADVPFGTIAINLSSAQFRDTSVADFILREIAVRGLPARMIEVEVTEGVFLSKSSETVLDVCRKLKQNGVRIAFDDFGTGFASLTHLTEFPVDIIKIDRSFVSTLETQASNRAIVNAIVGLCRALHLEVVAEGVESEAQAEFLRAGGCCSAQGYLFARPLPARYVAAWLDERKRQVA